MNISFSKYQGTGNDFIMIDHREQMLQNISVAQIKFLCDRRFGIGGDGLILLENTPEADFKMVYYNSDGNESTMCGNGGRCIARFAQDLGIIHSKGDFIAIDGSHEAFITNELVKLRMKNVKQINQDRDAWVLNTGSPHFVDFVINLKEFDVNAFGKKIRYSELYKKEGINVNFVEKKADGLFVRTYERGVEGETYSCGTGVTASAIAYHISTIKTVGDYEVNIETPGGNLKVYFNFNANEYDQVWLEGPAVKVFDGIINI